MNQDEQEIQVSTAEQSSEYEAVPTGQDGKREKQKKKKSGFGKGFAVGAVTMAVVCGVMSVSYTHLDVYKRQEHCCLLLR